MGGQRIVADEIALGDGAKLTLVLAIAAPREPKFGRQPTGPAAVTGALTSPMSDQLIIPPLITSLGLAPKSGRAAMGGTDARPARSPLPSADCLGPRPSSG